MTAYLMLVLLILIFFLCTIDISSYLFQPSLVNKSLIPSFPRGGYNVHAT